MAMDGIWLPRRGAYISLQSTLVSALSYSKLDACSFVDRRLLLVRKIGIPLLGILADRL